MGATVTPTQGYLATLTFGAKNVHVLGDIDIQGLDLSLDNVSALGDAIVPHQSFAPGNMDRGGVRLSFNVAYDAANDAIVLFLAHKIAGTALATILTDGTVTLLSGTAHVNFKYKTGLDGQQTMDVVLTYSGALTGSFVV